jgi:hypothetical protein
MHNAIVRAMVDENDAGLIGARDRAFNAHANRRYRFSPAWVRERVTALGTDRDLADLDFGRDGRTLILQRSKTDQDGVGRTVGILVWIEP